MRKATNLYRRVATVTYRNIGAATKNKRLNSSSAKCFVCLVTLVKSSKDKNRAGIKLRCQCNVRVCSTCFKNNPDWHLSEPHFTNCPTLSGFICTVCACFESTKEKVCCDWMCTRCSSERLQNQGSRCLKCSRALNQRSRRETLAVYRLDKHKEPCGDTVTNTSLMYAAETTATYRDVMRARVFDKVSQSRHLSPSDIRALFPECFAPQVCTCMSSCARNPMCASCTPVLTVLQLLAKNPRPLLASFAERSISGRALARNVYNRSLLCIMLNDQDLPSCANREGCKGMLLNPLDNPKPLTALISPQSYECFVSSRTKTGEIQQLEPCRCILCLLFNQSAAIAQMYNSHSLRLEPHPTGPVYYFNVKLSPDLGVPEVCMDDYQGNVVDFQGSVGSYKPTYYYNWREMLKVLHRDNTGKITVLP